MFKLLLVMNKLKHILIDIAIFIEQPLSHLIGIGYIVSIFLLFHQIVVWVIQIPGLDGTLFILLQLEDRLDNFLAFLIVLAYEITSNLHLPHLKRFLTLLDEHLGDSLDCVAPWSLFETLKTLHLLG